MTKPEREEDAELKVLCKQTYYGGFQQLLSDLHLNSELNPTFYQSVRRAFKGKRTHGF